MAGYPPAVTAVAQGWEVLPATQPRGSSVRPGTMPGTYWNVLDATTKFPGSTLVCRAGADVLGTAAAEVATRATGTIISTATLAVSRVAVGRRKWVAAMFNTPSPVGTGCSCPMAPMRIVTLELWMRLGVAQ